MERLTEAVSVDNIVKIRELLKCAVSSDNFCDEDSNGAVTLTAEDFQDAFVQAAFLGSLKSLQAIGEYGKIFE